MRVGISSVDTNPEALLAKVRQVAGMAGANLVEEVTTAHAYVVPAVGVKRYVVAAVDLGVKSNTPRRLAERGVETHVLPATATIHEVLALSPDAVFLSNGPGDPATADAQVALTREVLARRVPLFGICFGNQILGRALGFGTYKLKYGHRGINQPVMDRATGKIEVTAHNHGFAVAWPGREEGQHGAVAWPGREEGRLSAADASLENVAETEFGRVEVSHLCLNDGVVEGLRCLDVPAFSVQYHPEAAAGPHDADYLFDRLVELIERARRADGERSEGGHTNA
jgi:carbamoyl-phosphate synthase small subunit